MLDVVSNSGPIIHFNDINRLKLLNNFTKIFVPLKVSNEIGNLLSKLTKTNIIKVSSKDTNNLSKQLKRFKLHSAEIDAIYLAKKLDKIFLTDDLAAREAAKKLEIDVHGSIGIIVLFYKRGIISINEAKIFINDLYEKSSLFVSRAIVDIAMKEISK